MSPVIKCSAAVGLILGGFFSASLFGPPSPLLPSGEEATAQSATPQLQPLPVGGNDSLGPAAARPIADGGVSLANFTDAPQGSSGTVHAANFPQGSPTESPWSRPLAEHPSPGFSIPELRPATTPATPALPGEGSFANLTPPPRLGEFQNEGDNNPAPPATTTNSPPPATFATQPASPTSPWWQRPAGAQPSAPQPWATHSGTAVAANNSTFTHGPDATTAGSHRWHVVSDGDSLAGLAARYLQDAGRANEIFEENRNVLSNPEVLPIGVELRIPEAGARPATREVYDAQGTPHGEIHTRRRMVKLPEISSSVAEAPVARLGTPQSAGRGN